jgi:hypothetical protein
MKPEDPSPEGRIPEEPKQPADALEPTHLPAERSARLAKQAAAAETRARARKRKKPFVL